MRDVLQINQAKCIGWGTIDIGARLWPVREFDIGWKETTKMDSKGSQK